MVMGINFVAQLMTCIHAVRKNTKKSCYNTTKSLKNSTVLLTVKNSGESYDCDTQNTNIILGVAGERF